MGTLTPLLRFLREIGSPYKRLLEAAKIPIDLIDQAERPLPLLSAYRLFEIAAQKEGGEYVGLIAADYAQLEDFGGYGNTLLQSKTIYDHLMTAVKQLNTHATGEKFWLQEDGDSIFFCHATLPSVSKKQLLTTQFTLAITINTLRQCLGPNWLPEKIGLPALPTQRLDWHGLTGADILQAHGYGYFSFPKKLLIKPFTLRANQSSLVEGVVKAEPKKLEVGLVQSTTQLIEILFPYGYPDINQVTECAGVSKRTFQRMLKFEDVSYAKLVGEARIKLACEWLQHSNSDITVIAQQLAYNDASNFTRAFRRNTGLSPSAYRDCFR